MHNILSAFHIMYTCIYIMLLQYLFKHKIIFLYDVFFSATVSHFGKGMFSQFVSKAMSDKQITFVYLMIIKG